MIFIMDMLLLYPSLSVSITVQRTDLRTVCKIGIIHQILAVQADFFDKAEVIPRQRHASTAVKGHVAVVAMGKVVDCRAVFSRPL